MRLVLLEWPRYRMLLVAKWSSWLTYRLNVHTLWNIHSRTRTYWNHTSLMLSDSDVSIARGRLELTVCQSLSFNRRIGLHLWSLVNNVDISASLLLRSGNLLVLLMNLNNLSCWQNLLNDIWSESHMLSSNLFMLNRLFF